MVRKSGANCQSSSHTDPPAKGDSKRGRKRTPPRATRTSPDAAEERPIDSLRIHHLNRQVYGTLDVDSPRVVELAAGIQATGRIDPIRVTTDDYIVSGNTRYLACRRLGMARVPVIREEYDSDDPRFARDLALHNSQRKKSPAQEIREEVIRTCPDAAFERLATARAEHVERLMTGAEEAGLRRIWAPPARRRSEISDGKMEMVEAAKRILEANRKYWPLGLRQIHYRLLNDPPRRNTNPRYGIRIYRNDRASYQDLSDLLSRARVFGLVAWESFCDETRPVSVWRKWPNVGDYVRETVDNLFADYRRDLLQSQASHIEIVAEKLTVQATAERVAHRLKANVMVGRGFSSITARYELAQRFKASGKESLDLLILSDFDPEGECIAENLAGSIRDEFGIEAPVRAHKVALTAEQVEQFELVPGEKAKKSSSRYRGFVARHGDDVYELEALEPAQLEALIRDALVAVIDPDLLRHEQERERAEAKELEARRQIMLRAIGD